MALKINISRCKYVLHLLLCFTERACWRHKDEINFIFSVVCRLYCSEILDINYLSEILFEMKIQRRVELCCIFVLF